MTLFRFPPSSFLLAASASAAKALNIQDAKEKGITVISATVDADCGTCNSLRDTFIGQNFCSAFGSNQPRGVGEI